MKRRLCKPSIALALVLGLLVVFNLVEFTVVPVDFRPTRAMVFYPVWSVLLIAAIAWLIASDWRVESKRWVDERAVAEAWGAKAGFHGAEVPRRGRADFNFVALHKLPEGFRRLRFFHDWADSFPGIAWMLQRPTPAGKLLVFRYLVGDPASPQISNLAVAFCDERLSLPEFVLQPRLPLDDPPFDRAPWSWIAGRVPRASQVQLEGRPAFMNRFVLYGPDPAAIAALFTGERADFFEAECLVGDPPRGSTLASRRRWHAEAWDRSWCVEAGGAWVLAYRPTFDERKFEPLKPEVLDRFVVTATRVYEVFSTL